MSGLDGLGWPTEPDDDDDFLYGVGEGSHIDRVPFAGKVRNQTTENNDLYTQSEISKLMASKDSA